MWWSLAGSLIAVVSFVACLVLYGVSKPGPLPPDKDAPLMEDDEITYMSGAVLLFFTCMFWILLRAQ